MPDRKYEILLSMAGTRGIFAFVLAFNLTSRSRSHGSYQVEMSPPKVKFRVLIMGRANAGKTTILQRVCNTTDSPKIYRNGEELVCIL